ncbi:MAG: efflux transporter outer membrane subunit [bacterium]|nr:efflux transporter outer membrane subunit [bacterium]
MSMKGFPVKVRSMESSVLRRCGCCGVAILAVLTLSSCGMNRAESLVRSSDVIPEHIKSGAFPDSSVMGELAGEVCKSEDDILWWDDFSDQSLTSLMKTAFVSGYELPQVAMRLRQAEAQAQIASSRFWPQLSLSSSAAGQKTEGGARPTAFNVDEYYTAQGNLSYEVDIFGKVKAGADAADYGVLAAELDLDAARLTLSGRIYDTWIDVLESKKIVEVVQDQIATSRVLLELTEARYRRGTRQALDVLELQRQLAALEVLLPQAEERKALSLNSLVVLTGNAEVGAVKDFYETSTFPELPPLPAAGASLELLNLRPDLGSTFLQLRASERRADVAFLDRLPSLTLALSYELAAMDIHNFAETVVRQISAALVLPVVDGGRRAAEQDRQEAIADELRNRYIQSVLVAVREVNDGVVAEHFISQSLNTLKRQEEIARRALAEASRRYENGLVDYLRVVTALQTVQQVERTVVSEQARLLKNRGRLYRALGGRRCESAVPVETEEGK